MGHRSSHHHPRRPSWNSLERDGLLTQRHSAMAIELGLEPETIVDDHRRAQTSADQTLLEWVEDECLARFGRCVPDTMDVTAESQAEDPSEKSMLPDEDEIFKNYLLENEIDPEDADAVSDSYETLTRLRERAERETPVSCGEIREEDEHMLKRQEGFRLGARKLALLLQELPEVQKTVLFGSVALPLWKERCRHSRLRNKGIFVYHECRNIDMAVWITTPACAPTIRKSVVRATNELLESGLNLSIAHHHFSVHLIDQATGKYWGMTCFFGKCPKAGNRECQVPGCGQHKFVRVLPWFRLKPERLNSFNSQVLFQRGLPKGT